jgi:hypothetical protein
VNEGKTVIKECLARECTDLGCIVGDVGIEWCEFKIGNEIVMFNRVFKMCVLFF